MVRPNITIVLGSGMLAIYFLSCFFIGGIQKTQIQPPSWSSQDILTDIQKYDFNGAWFETGRNSMTSISDFRHTNGTAFMRIFADPTSLTSLKIGNFTLDDNNPFQLHVRLNDGFEFSTSKFDMNLKFDSVHEKENNIVMNQKKIVGGKNKVENCSYNVNLRLVKERLKKTKFLEDLVLTLKINSRTPNCETSLNIKFNYNSFQSNQRIFKFLTFSLLIGIYEMILIFLVILKFEANENSCKSQGVIFWTSVGMFNCLFCFVSITATGDHSERVVIFFLNSLIHFANFAIIVLKILHKIGRVQLTEIVSQNVN